jgi:hypothetical protein
VPVTSPPAATTAAEASKMRDRTFTAPEPRRPP